MDVGELRGLITLKDQFSDPVRNCARELGLFKGSLGAITGFAGLAAAAVTAVGGTIVALGSHGAEVADVQGAFGRLSDEIGSTAEVMLGGLRRGTVGAISDLELMRMANKALGAGLVTNAGDMETLAAGARMLGKQTGVDTAQSFNTLTQAIASGRTAQLKQLGLFVDSKVALENYAAKIGKSTSELTDSERAHALSAATVEKLRERLAAAGLDGADFGEVIAGVWVQVRNFTDKLSVAISQSPVLMAGLRAAGAAFTGAFGDNQQGLVKTIVGLVEKFAIGITYVGQAGTIAATILVSAFYGVKTIILGVETAVVGLVDGLAEMLNGIMQGAARIPGLGSAYKDAAASTQELVNWTRAATKSLAEQTAEAAKGVAGQSEAQRAIDRFGGALINIRGAMQDAARSHAGLAEAAKKVTVATGEESALARKHALEVAGIMQQLENQLELVGRQGLDKRLRELKLAQAKEIQAIRQNEKLTEAERAKAIVLIEARYAKEVAVARASGDSIQQGRQKLEQAILLATQTGVQKRLTEIKFEEQAELDSLETLRIANEAEWAARVELVRQKYEQMRATAQGHYLSVQQAAEAEGLKTREELQHSVDVARQTYEDMKRSGLYTYATLRDAHQKYKEAEAALNHQTAMTEQQERELLASSASGILRSLFGKSKTAAIAAAIIDTYAAAAKANSAYPPPWNAIAIAAALAAGWAQVNQIRSQNASFREGTEGLTYRDFGRETTGALHGVEAVVPQAKVGDLAGDIAARLGGAVGRVPPIVVQLVANGRKLAEVVVPEIPRVLAAHGVG